jgi:molybdopterin/thiamine biosynthesis adenylyltransferase
MTDKHSVRYSRQTGIITPEELPPLVKIIGVGGLGSHTAERLARTGCPRIEVYDDDVVEAGNLGSQAFLNDAVDKPKVQAVQEKLALVSEAEVIVHPEKFSGSVQEKCIVIVLTDSMESRQQIWDAVQYDPDVDLYVEARMAGLFGRIYALNPSDPEKVALYETTLYKDENTAEVPCTMKGVDFNCSAIADLIAAIVAAHARGKKFPLEIVLDLANFSILKRDTW